jgi:hypothetical protein
MRIDAGGTVVSARVRAPASPRGALFVFGHGAGGALDDRLLVALDRLLEERGHGVVRFNFAYREAGRRLPDPVPRLETTYRAVIEHARAAIAHGRLFIGGKSMGGRIATHLAAEGERVDGVVLLGYPLHPAKRPDKLRDAHLGRIGVPVLFLQGTRDPLCDLALLLRAVQPMGERATVHVVEGGDHSLGVARASGRTKDEVREEIGAAVDAWLDGFGA